MQTFLRLLKAAAFFTMLVSVHVSNAQKIQSEKSQSEKKEAVTTKYGLYPLKNDVDSKLVAANNVVVDYVRQSTVLTRWDGADDGGIDYWLSRKKKVVLNINYDDNPSYFPTDLTTYKNKLQSFLNVYGKSIELAVIENEELNYDTARNLYHYGSMQNYINELKAALSVCTPLKIPVTNGGLASQVVASLKHYYDINGKKDSAQWLITQMGGGIPADSMVWKRCDSLLNAYKTMALSYVNLHWYEPKKGMTRITGVLQTICNYITTRTGKKVITNESGTRSDSSFITRLMQQWSLIKPEYCILIDGTEGNNNGGMPLTSATGNLLPTGMAYRDYIGGGKACTQTITVTPSNFINSCNGATLTLTASSGFGTYLWNNGLTTQSITVKATGNFSVKSDHKSCVAYSKSAAAVLMNAAPVKPTVTTNPSPPVNICPGKSVNLKSSVATSYLWSTGETSKSISVINPGNYTVTVSDKNGCKATSNVTAVTYQPCSAPGSLKVTGISINKATLTWKPVSCAKGYQVQYRIKGITAWTTSQLTSGVTSSKTIYGLTAAVYQWRMLTYCNYSPDTIKSVYVYGPDFTISALKNTSNSIAANLNGFDVTLYPVPAKNVATVSVSPISNDLKITLTDVYGKVLWQSEKITSAVTSLPVAGLASGTYIVVVKDKEHSKTLWLIKE